MQTLNVKFISSITVLRKGHNTINNEIKQSLKIRYCCGHRDNVERPNSNIQARKGHKQSSQILMLCSAPRICEGRRKVVHFCRHC